MSLFDSFLHAIVWKNSLKILLLIHFPNRQVLMAIGICPAGNAPNFLPKPTHFDSRVLLKLTFFKIGF